MRRTPPRDAKGRFRRRRTRRNPIAAEVLKAGLSVGAGELAKDLYSKHIHPRVAGKRKR